MKKILSKLIYTAILLVLLLPSYGQTIVNTKHNLSATGPGTVKATTESEICIFCHTPHNASPRAPLWNKNVFGGTYTLYNSSTLNAVPGQPDGNSILCLSCHDGTIALGSVLSRPAAISMTGAMPTSRNLTTDLSNDHPVSFLYNAALATADGQLKAPPLTTVKLDHNSKLQCTSCHDSHSAANPSFLRASQLNSALCFLCHNRNYWVESTHSTSTKTWNAAGTNPWAHVITPLSTVSQNACANCHDQHNAVGKLRLLKSAAEENNCLDCHNGNVAAKNIQAQFAKINKHNVAGYLGIHDPVEATSVTTKHVECQDCHNPHASNAATAAAPFVNGFNRGVSGINQSGTAVAVATNTYEICYKCHAGNSLTPANFPRVLVQNNVRLEFATNNPSFHPVVGARNNPDVVPNLLPPNTATTVLYCTSCHASDGTGSPAGPHGSTFPHILKLQFNTISYANGINVPESAQNYALCYSCHNRTNILAGTNSFVKHPKHTAKVSCNVCHDPHGISSTQGTSVNHSNLINFRTDIITPDRNGILKYVDTGLRTGECYLTCHGRDHSPRTY